MVGSGWRSGVGGVVVGAGADDAEAVERVR